MLLFCIYSPHISHLISSTFHLILLNSLCRQSNHLHILLILSFPYCLGPASTVNKVLLILAMLVCVHIVHTATSLLQQQT